MVKFRLSTIAPQGCGVITKSKGKNGGYITKIIAENGEMLCTSKQVLNDLPTAIKNLFQTRNALTGEDNRVPMVVLDRTQNPHSVCYAYYSGTLEVQEEYSTTIPKKKKESL